MNNLKQELLYEITKNERSYKFYLPTNAPLGELYDVVYGLLAEIITEANKASELAKPPVKEEPKEVEVEIVNN